MAQQKSAQSSDLSAWLVCGATDLTDLDTREHSVVCILGVNSLLNEVLKILQRPSKLGNSVSHVGHDAKMPYIVKVSKISPSFTAGNSCPSCQRSVGKHFSVGQQANIA